MKLNVSKHVTDLPEHKIISLRNHIGNAYNLAEDLDGCDPVKDYDIQRRKITDVYGNEPTDSIVPILTISIDTKDEAHEMFKIAEEICPEYNIGLYDVWYNNDENQMMMFIEPFKLK